MKIALLGDTALFGKYTTENNKVFEYFREVRERLKEYDVVIANLETPFNTKSKPTGYKSAYISSDPKNVEILKYLGISIVNLANNHIFDYGIDVYTLTKKVLEDNQIDYFGVEGKNMIIEQENNRIYINGFCCYSTNPLGLGRKGINALNYQIVGNILTENQKLGNNTILSIHAGQEHINYPNYDHILFARKLSEITPYVYYGHHPHVLQGMESYQNSLLAYSLGNFCFDDLYTGKSKRPLVRQSENNKSSIILELKYVNNQLVRHEAIPIYSGEDRMEIGHYNILDGLKDYSSRLLLEAKDYVSKRNEVLSSIHRKRTLQRDFMWYLKRINMRTFFLIKDILANRRKYNLRFKKYL